MRENYHSFDFWENVISKNKTIRGHVFMQNPPTENSIYFHTMIFSKKNGINNSWSYFPNIRSLIGYIQYSFLQEAFYKLIYGQNQRITNVPSITVEKMIADGERDKKITREMALKMKKDYEDLNKLWELPSSKAERELKRFVREFNKKWLGDNKEFIYIKFFNTPKEVGEFVVSSGLITSTEEELENKIGMEINKWKDICNSALKNSMAGEIFRKTLLRKLTEVF